MRRLTCIFSLAVVTALGAAACGTLAQDEERVHTITVVPLGAAADDDDAGAIAFKALVESLSNDRIAVEIDRDGRRCGNPTDCLTALQAGVIEVHRSTIEDFSELFPEMQVLDVPYLFESDEVVELVFQGAFFARMRDAILDRTSLRLVAVSNAGGWRNIANTRREVRTPDDVRGLTLGTADLPVQLELTRAFGALPALATRDEVAEAVTSGEVEGVRSGIADIAGMVVHERPMYLTLDRHNYMTALWLMNDEAYQALPPDLQQVVRAGFDELKRLTRALPKAREAEAIAVFKAAGGTVYTPTPEEQKAFIMAGGRVSTWFMDEYGYEWLVWLEGAIAEAEREIALARARRP